MLKYLHVSRLHPHYAAPCNLRTSAQSLALHCTPLQYFYQQFNGDLTQANPNAVSLIGSALRLVFHDAAEYSPSTFGVSDWYRSDGCINTADPSNGGIAASIALLDVVWTTL
jgi:hypothetical protein